MRLTWAALLHALAILGLAVPAAAGSLQLSTVGIDVTSPTAATVITLRNTGVTPITAQLRIFKWLQISGQEHLVPTTEVVASPPMALIEPGAQYSVRVVRTSRFPVADEESYRLIIDDVPNNSTLTKTGVQFMSRYSLPVFFGRMDRRSQDLQWSATIADGELRLKAINPGTRRVRLAALRIGRSRGEDLVARPGLVGYVLGQSEMNWSFPLKGNVSLAGPASLSVLTDTGSVNASITIN